MPANRTCSRAIEFSVLAVAFALLASCSASNQPSVPSDPEAEKQLAERIATESEGRARLVSFQKVEGSQAQAMAVSFYRLRFDSQIEFTQECKWLLPSDGSMFRTRPLLADKAAWPQYFENTQYPGVIVKKGQREQVAATLVFSKTDSTWSVPSLEK